jgi:hypothetical protein
MKEILKASPNFGKRVGYKMCVVDELHDIKELEKINADLKQSLDWANEREKELKAQIEKMKCCENCKHHYWLYEELACRIHKIDVDTCNSWEMKND